MWCREDLHDGTEFKVVFSRALKETKGRTTKGQRMSSKKSGQEIVTTKGSKTERYPIRTRQSGYCCEVGN